MASMQPSPQQPCAGSLGGPSASLTYIAMAPQQHQHPHYAPPPIHWSHDPPSLPQLQLRAPQPRHFGGLMSGPPHASGLVGAGPDSDDGRLGGHDDMDQGGGAEDDDAHHLRD